MPTQNKQKTIGMRMDKYDFEIYVAGLVQNMNWMYVDGGKDGDGDYKNGDAWQNICTYEMDAVFKQAMRKTDELEECIENFNEVLTGINKFIEEMVMDKHRLKKVKKKTANFAKYDRDYKIPDEYQWGIIEEEMDSMFKSTKEYRKRLMKLLRQAGYKFDKLNN